MKPKFCHKHRKIFIENFQIFILPEDLPTSTCFFTSNRVFVVINYDLKNYHTINVFLKKKFFMIHDASLLTIL